MNLWCHSGLWILMMCMYVWEFLVLSISLFAFISLSFSLSVLWGQHVQHCASRWALALPFTQQHWVMRTKLRSSGPTFFFLWLFPSLLVSHHSVREHYRYKSMNHCNSKPAESMCDLHQNNISCLTVLPLILEDHYRKRWKREISTIIVSQFQSKCWWY